MSHARFIVGDTRDVTASLADASVDLVLTSPPFLALRSYLPLDHPDKHREIGSEPTPGEFLDTLLGLVEDWRRVLAPHGSIAVELGDTYSGSGGGGGDYLPGGLREDQPGFGGSAARAREGNAAHWRQKNQAKKEWPLPKSLCGIPHLFHLSLAYGRNMLTGRELEPWRVRNVVAWCRPNPPVGALGDKFRPATSYMTIATVAKDRYFDLDAVRGKPEDVLDQRVRTTNGPKQDAGPEVLTANYRNRIPSNPAGPPPLDWWEIPTQPYAGSHYATWPERLCERPIKAMVPEKVCTTCGEPSRRITVGSYTESYNEGERERDRQGRGRKKSAGTAGRVRGNHDHPPEEGWQREHETVGWTDCGHDTWRRGIVLDPFAGSGTTLAVASGLGRDALGIDIDERNAELARDRVGPMFFELEHFATEVVA